MLLHPATSLFCPWTKSIRSLCWKWFVQSGLPWTKLWPPCLSTTLGTGLQLWHRDSSQCGSRRAPLHGKPKCSLIESGMAWLDLNYFFVSALARPVSVGWKHVELLNGLETSSGPSDHICRMAWNPDGHQSLPPSSHRRLQSQRMCPARAQLSQAALLRLRLRRQQRRHLRRRHLGQSLQLSRRLRHRHPPPPPPPNALVRGKSSKDLSEAETSDTCLQFTKSILELIGESYIQGNIKQEAGNTTQWPAKSKYHIQNTVQLYSTNHFSQSLKLQRSPSCTLTEECPPSPGSLCSLQSRFSAIPMEDEPLENTVVIDDEGQQYAWHQRIAPSLWFHRVSMANAV